MFSVWFIVILTLLCVANIFLLCALACSGKRETNKATRIGFGFMGAVLVLDMFFSVGGVVLW